MRSFHGVIPYLVSPVDEAGRIKRDVLATLCRDLIAKGVHGLTPLGSTGEFAYLSPKQKRDVVETVVEAAAGKVPVIAGVAATTTSDATAQARLWRDIGCDGILAIMEAYFPVPDQGVLDYFTAVAKATELPVVLYTNPNFQRSDLSLPVIRKLASLDTVCAIKDASSNTGRLLSILNDCGNKLDVFAASAHIPACVMLIGGKGWMAGPACVAPEASLNLYQLCLSGDWNRAMQAPERLMETQPGLCPALPGRMHQRRARHAGLRGGRPAAAPCPPWRKRPRGSAAGARRTGCASPRGLTRHYAYGNLLPRT